jgi:hypothetical protein
MTSLLHHFHLFQILKTSSDDGTSSQANVSLGDSVPALLAKQAPKTPNTKTRVQIDSASDGSKTDEIPVRVHWCNFLRGSSLHKVDPLGEFDLSALLKMLCKLLDVSKSLDIFDGKPVVLCSCEFHYYSFLNFSCVFQKVYQHQQRNEKTIN